MTWELEVDRCLLVSEVNRVGSSRFLLEGAGDEELRVRCPRVFPGSRLEASAEL